MAAKLKKRKKAEDSAFLRWLEKLLPWAVLLLVIAVLVLPTAGLFALVDLLFDGPIEGVKTFAGVALIVIVFYGCSFAWDMWKQRRNGR